MSHSFLGPCILPVCWLDQKQRLWWWHRSGSSPKTTVGYIKARLWLVQPLPASTHSARKTKIAEVSSYHRNPITLPFSQGVTTATETTGCCQSFFFMRTNPACRWPSKKTAEKQAIATHVNFQWNEEAVGDRPSILACALIWLAADERAVLDSSDTAGDQLKASGVFDSYVSAVPLLSNRLQKSNTNFYTGGYLIYLLSARPRPRASRIIPQTAPYIQTLTKKEEKNNNCNCKEGGRGQTIRE